MNTSTYLRQLGDKYLDESARTEPGELIDKGLLLDSFAQILFKAANQADYYDRQEIKDAS